MTPTQVGCVADVNAPVDNAIARERTTGNPIVPGSALKGTLLRWCKRTLGANVAREVFGTNEASGKLPVTDAQLVAFPVKSARGLFGWASCPLILDRLNQLADGALFTGDVPTPGRTEDGLPEVLLPGNTSVKFTRWEGTRELELVEWEMLLFALREDGSEFRQEMLDALDPATTRAFKEKMKQDWGVVSEDSYRVLTTQATDLQARVRIGEAGTVEKGALWTEEYLPACSMLVGFLLREGGGENVDVLLKALKKGVALQVGGNETTGKGFVTVKAAGPLAGNANA
ncbi:MAG: type III-B CRISPR module RAMP protein Cmr4 [Promethearchaeota archaeon]